LSFRYNDILQLPERCLLNRKLTKSFFLKNFDLSTVEKKLLNSTIQGMEWLANIKPSNANILAIKNENYIYDELQVMVCKLANNQMETSAKRCIELFQKYIPYQMLVIIEDEVAFIMNTCDKRINQNDKSLRTIEGYFTTLPISKLYKNELSSSFYKALEFSKLDKTNLETTYKGFIQAVVQYQAASLTGTFKNRTQKRTEEDMADLLAIEAVEKEIVSLISQLKKESQLNGKVALNIAIQKKRKDIKNIKNKLIQYE
jgi:hypothetical protein